MELYTESGHLDFRAVRSMPYPFIIVIGGRGTGKTYGALQTSIEDGKFFAFMRRTKTQLDLISSPEFSPINSVCRQTGWKIRPAPLGKGISAYYYYEEEDGKIRTYGAPLGINLALSTVANVRGFDASALDLLIYDEAIPEKGERPLKNEWEKLENCYETLNRNRELEGRPALQMICLANANRQTAPILEGLRLVDTLDRMIAKEQELYTDPKRGLALLLLRDSPISRAKAGTALYRLSAGTQYAQMALGNRFAYEDKGRIQSLPLAEFRPLATVGEVTIYRHKSKRLIYVSRHRAGSPEIYRTTDLDLLRFRRSYGWILDYLLEDAVVFETYEVQTILTSYYNL